MRRPATHIRLIQKAVANAIVDPAPFHPQLAGQTADRPLLIHLVHSSMLMIRTAPQMAVANLHDSLGQDRLTLRRAKPFTAQDVGNLKVRVAFSQQLPRAFDDRIVARQLWAEGCSYIHIAYFLSSEGEAEENKSESMSFT